MPLPPPRGGAPPTLLLLAGLGPGGHRDPLAEAPEDAPALIQRPPGAVPLLLGEMLLLLLAPLLRDVTRATAGAQDLRTADQIRKGVLC